MFKANVNKQFDFIVNLNEPNLNWDIVEQSKNHKFHIISENDTYNVEVAKIDLENKALIIYVNNNKYTVLLKDANDQLLEQLGLSNLNTINIKDIKAPMPGLVLDILVKPGNKIKKGDNLLILEAMKMENIIKAPADAEIKSIEAIKGAVVEKGQILIKF